MVKHTQTMRRQNCLSVFDHFVGFALKGLKILKTKSPIFLALLPLAWAEMNFKNGLRQFLNIKIM